MSMDHDDQQYHQFSFKNSTIFSLNVVGQHALKLTSRYQ